MRVSVKKKQLIDKYSAFQSISSVIPDNGALSFFKISTENSTISFILQDNDVAVKLDVPVNVLERDEFKEICYKDVPFKEIIESISTFKTEDCIFDTKGRFHLMVSDSKGDRFIDYEYGTNYEYEFSKYELEKYIEIPTHILAQSKGVMFDYDSFRFKYEREIFTNVIIDLNREKDKACFVFSDTIRLAYLEKSIAESGIQFVNWDSDSTKITIPYNVLNKLNSVFKKLRIEKVKIHKTKENYIIDLGNLVVKVNNLEEYVYNYESVIPNNFEGYVDVSMADLVDSIEFFEIKAKKAAKGKRITQLDIKSEGNSLILKLSEGLTDMKDKINVLEISGNFDISLDVKPLSGLLAIMSEGVVRINFSTAHNPIKMHQKGNDKHFALLMPIRRDER